MMTTDLRGKIALVTGSGKRSGIGYAVARKLAACGANVIIADLIGKETRQNAPATGSADELSGLAGELEKKFNIKSLSVELDVRRADSIQQMADKVQNQFNCIHILCNNAGAVFSVPNAICSQRSAGRIRPIGSQMPSTGDS